MISKRYLALLTSAAMTTTIVVPAVNAEEPTPVVDVVDAEANAEVEAQVEENEPAEAPVEIQPANTAEDFTVPAQLNTEAMAGGPASTVTVEATGGSGNYEYSLGDSATLPPGVTAAIVDNVVTLTASRDAAPGSTGYIMVPVRHYAENGQQSVKGVRVNVKVNEFENLAEGFRLLDEEVTVTVGGTANGQFDVEDAEGRVVHSLGDPGADWPAGLDVVVNEDGSYTVTADENVAPGRYGIMHWARHYHPNGQESNKGSWLHVNVEERTGLWVIDETDTIEAGEEKVYETNLANIYGYIVQFYVYDAEGNPKSAAGWGGRLGRNTLTITAPADAQVGDTVEVRISGPSDDGPVKVGQVNLTVVEDTDVPPVDEDEDGSSVGGSSLPLLIGLGLAGSALAGSAVLSSANGSAVADGSSAAGDGAQGQAPDSHQAPAADTGAPVDDPKAVAQAQAAKAQQAPVQKQAAAQKQAPVQQTQATQQRQLANTGVEGTLVALVAGLLAVSAGVLLLLRRRA